MKPKVIKKAVQEVVVEGTGDVVRRYYAEKLEKFTQEYGLHVTFIDNSSFGQDDSEYRKKIEKIKQDKLHWADHFDKASLDYQQKIGSLHPDVVFVCTPSSTHCDVAREWILREKEKRPLIFIEKPLDTNLEKARMLLGYCGYQDERIFVFDHYRARWPRQLSVYDALKEQFAITGKKKWLKSFEFYFLEDHSSNDEEYLKSNPYARKEKHGPIEIENRVKDTNDGLILDMMPHALAFLNRFAILGTVRPTHVMAGQYTGVDGDLSKRTEIAKETLAVAKFRFKDIYHARDAEGTVYLGKGVGGVRALNIKGEVKLAKLVGENGAEARFNFKPKSEKSELVLETESGPGPTYPLQDPYDFFLRSVIEGKFSKAKQKVGIYLEDAKRMLEIMEDTRYPISSKDMIPTYPLGSIGGQTPFLEDAISKLRFVFPL